MRISETIREFVDLIDAYSQNRLRERDHLAILLEAARTSGMQADIGRLAFHGKYVSRLHATLIREGSTGEHAESLRTEFRKATEEFRDLLKPLIAAVAEEDRQILERDFLGMDQVSMKRLLSLAGDFLYVKNWELEFTEQEDGDPDETKEPA